MKEVFEKNRDKFKRKLRHNKIIIWNTTASVRVGMIAGGTAGPPTLGAGRGVITNT